MHRRRTVPSALTLLAACLAGLAGARAESAEPPAPRDPGRPAAALPGMLEGVWNATMQIASPDDAPPQILNGIEVNTLGGGGAWVISEFRSQLEGMPFEGHAILSWNEASGRFRRVWADVTSPTFWLSEGTWSQADRTLTMWIETVNSNGRPVRWREETIFQDDDTRTFTMYVPGAGTTEAAAITIMYRRRPEGAPPRPLFPAPEPPSPEHALLGRDEGTWDVRIKDRRGGSPGSSKGTVVNRLCCDGLFLLSDLAAGSKKRPFSVHALVGYDPVHKHYVRAQVDSLGRRLELSEGHYDPASDALTLHLDDPSGADRGREVLEWDGENSRTLTVRLPGAEGSAVGATWTFRRARPRGPR